MDIKAFFQTIQWKSTLQIAAIRILIASLLWPLISLLLGNTTTAEYFANVFSFLILLTIFIAIAIPAIGWSRANVPLVSLAALPAWLVVIADPFVKLLHAKHPNLVPVDEFKLINPPVLAVFATAEPVPAEDGQRELHEDLGSRSSFKESIPSGLTKEGD